MLELKKEGNKVTAQLPLSEGATGLRDIHTQVKNSLGADVDIKVQSILIDCSDNHENHITVSYRKKTDSADKTVLGEWQGAHYKLLDEPAIVEFEINPETGEEIEGTRVVVKEENLHLTDWNASPVADAIVEGTLNHVTEIENK